MKVSKNIRRIALVLAIAVTSVSLSTTPSRADEKTEAQDKLNDKKNEIKDLDKLKQEIDADLNKVVGEMNELLTQQETLQAQIDEISLQIEETEVKLEEIEEQTSLNYEAMKVRIKYMYENGTDITVWNSVLNAETIGDMLNQIEYIQAVYKKDRQQLDDYAKALAIEEQTKTELAEQREELLAASEEFALQQEELGVYMAALQDKSDDYGEAIAKAEKIAAGYEATIYRIDHPDSVATTGTSANFPGTIGGANPISVSAANLDRSVSYLTDSSYNPAKQTTVSQVELVQYALEFVGCHYVWGGNTMGCRDWSDGYGVDCSGFVHEVYKHFGINTVRYSQSFKNVGQPVAFENIQPGDIVVYPGHVALYVGDGYIVEAQASKAGVTANRLVSRGSSRITAIRRLL